MTLKGSRSRAGLSAARGRFRTAAGVARRLDSPMVGRERELTLLLGGPFDRAIERRSCEHRDRVWGRPGRASRGSTREFVARVGDRARRAPGPLPALRRGHHLLAGGRGRETAPPIIEEAHSPRAGKAKIAALLPEARSRGRSSEAWPGPSRSRRGLRGRRRPLWAIRRLFEALAERSPLRARLRRHPLGRGEPSWIDRVRCAAERRCRRCSCSASPDPSSRDAAPRFRRDR